MTHPAPFASKVFVLADELARQRGWRAAGSPKSRHFAIGRTCRLSLQAKGRVVVATVAFTLDPDATLETPDGFARKIGAGLAEVAISVAPPRLAECAP